MPVDVGGMIIYGGLYLLGLFVVFPVVLFCCKEGATRRVLAWLFAVYFFGPIVFTFTVVISRDMKNAHIQKISEQKNLEAFGNYCKGRRQTINRRISKEYGVSLLVRIEKSFTGNTIQYSVSKLHDYFGEQSDLCSRTSIRTLKAPFVVKYIKEEKRYEESELRTYAMCKKPTVKVYSSREEVIPDVDSRFELVLGQTGSKDSVPFSTIIMGEKPFRHPTDWWMSNSSIQIADRLTGEILAEDTMYFLRYDTGIGGCPDGMEQISNLLTEVFGHR